MPPPWRLGGQVYQLPVLEGPDTINLVTAMKILGVGFGILCMVCGAIIAAFAYRRLLRRRRKRATRKLRIRAVHGEMTQQQSHNLQQKRPGAAYRHGDVQVALQTNYPATLARAAHSSHLPESGVAQQAPS